LRSHVEFAYRHFRQIYAAPFVHNRRIQADSDSLHKNIGHEWMLYCLLKEWKNLEVEVGGAAFRAAVPRDHSREKSPIAASPKRLGNFGVPFRQSTQQ